MWVVGYGNTQMRERHAGSEEGAGDEKTILA